MSDPNDPRGRSGGEGPKKRPRKPAQSTIIGQLPPRPTGGPATPAPGGSKELDQGAAGAWGAGPTPPPAGTPAPGPMAPPPPVAAPAPPPPVATPAPPPAYQPPPQPAQSAPADPNNPFGAQQTPQPAPPPMPSAAPGVGAAAGTPQSDASFFPQTGQQQPQTPAAPHPGQKIELDAALRAVGIGQGTSNNPIIAAAADLLILFGRLRTGLVEMSAQPLLDHVTRAIETFDVTLQQAGVDQHEAQIAKYVLCGTADDVVQNIPGADRHVWVQYSMAARFFNQRTTGEGFFHEVEKALQTPAQRINLLELMLVCLSLGFEGRYRTVENGQVELHRIRKTIYDKVSQVRPRPDDDISPRWQGVVLERGNFGQTPVWAVASVIGVLVFGLFIALRFLLAQDGSAVAQTMSDIHPEGTVRIERPDPVPDYVPPPPVATTQLERIRTAMAEDLSNQVVEIQSTSKYIIVRMNNLVLFASGSAELKPEFAALGQRLGTMLNAEPGPVIVVGHTDSIPLSGRGRFKSNFELSVARAEAVRTVMDQYLTNPDRTRVLGQGADSPIATNKTPQGRALNRRVDLLIQREETL